MYVPNEFPDCIPPKWVSPIAYHVNFAISVTYFLIEIQLLCMGIHVIVQKSHFSMMRICVDDHRCSELRYGHCKKDHAGEFRQFDLEDR